MKKAAHELIDGLLSRITSINRYAIDFVLTLIFLVLNFTSQFMLLVQYPFYGFVRLILSASAVALNWHKPDRSGDEKIAPEAGERCAGQSDAVEG